MKRVLKNILRGELIVSVQALENEPLHSSFIMSKMANAVIEGGAKAIRANSIVDIIAIKEEIGDIPLIGIVKTEYKNSDVYITPTLIEVKSLIEANVDIIALDATNRKRPKETLIDLINYIREHSDILIMADCSNFDEMCRACEMGFDIISTTLVGYTDSSKNQRLEDDNYKIIREFKRKFPDSFLIVEGNVNSPEILKEVYSQGADSVVVGSMITRPQIITRAFVNAIKEKNENNTLY